MEWLARLFRIPVVKLNADTDSREPGSVLNLTPGFKSDFATDFELLGRTGERNAATQQSNPTWSPMIRRLTEGYKTAAEKQEYQQKRAGHSQQANSSGIQKLLHTRN